MTDVIDSSAGAATSGPSSSTQVQAAAKAKTVFAGYSAAQLLIGAVVIFAIMWAVWVTRTVMTDKPQRIVKADLSRIVGEFVQAHARSASPPAEVEAQMRTFMASLDTELQRRGANGQVVLVGEAVLSKSVPDITADVARAVYATGIKVPAPASPAQLGAMMQGQVPTVPTVTTTEPAQVASAAPAPNPFGPMPTMTAPEEAPVIDPASTGASVSTFGGPGGQ